MLLKIVYRNQELIKLDLIELHFQIISVHYTIQDEYYYDHRVNIVDFHN